MAIANTDSIIWTYLTTPSTAVDPLITLISDRVYCPRLPKNLNLTTAPAISFFTRGGTSDPYIPGIIEPSVQFDCWGKSMVAARGCYRKLYDALQGVQNVVTGSTQGIISAIEEVQGQDLVDTEIPNYFRVLTFFRIMIRAE